MKDFLRLFYDNGVDWGGVGAGALSGAAAGSVVPGWGTAIGAVVGAGSALIGGLQRNKANKLFGQNPYPIQNVPQAELDNQQLALQMANEGLPSQQYANAMTNIQRQQASALRSAADRKAGVGLIGPIQQNTNNAVANLDVANAQARIKNRMALMGVNNRLAGYQQAAWDWNNKNKYNQNYNYAMNLQGAGNANIMHGIDVLGSAALRYGGGLFGKTTMPGDNKPVGWYGSDPLGNGPAQNSISGSDGTIG
jgi:hypothetical protein